MMRELDFYHDDVCYVLINDQPVPLDDVIVIDGEARKIDG